MNKNLTISPSPHIYGNQSIKKLMYGVIVALIPAYIFSVYFYGISAIIVSLISVISCVTFEYLIQRYILKTKVSITDGSAIITGLLLAFNVPSNLPWWIIIIGSLVAIGLAKMTFGGLGNNPFNPALVARVFLLISFPTAMTVYPKSMGFETPYFINDNDIEAFTGATPLSLIKHGIKSGESVSQIMENSGLTYNNMFMGNIGGSLGEIAAIALLIGLVYMLIKKIITLHIPLSIIGTVFICTGILWIFSVDGHEVVLDKLNIHLPIISYQNNDEESRLFQMADPLFHILTGGVMLGAIFMATDYVTSPMLPKGMIIYGVLIGIITVAIRLFGDYPEGISFAILIMNGFTPLINRYVKPKRFGEVIKNGK